MVYDLHYSIFVGLFYILIIAIEHLKWTNLWRHNEWEKFVWRSCSPSGCCCCYASILLSKVSREMNWRIGLLEPETQHMTVPNWGNRVMKKSGSWKRKIGWTGLEPTEILSFPLSLFPWWRYVDEWLCASLCLCALGNSFRMNSISYKGSNPYPIFFLCQDCSCINQDSLWETFAINPLNKQTNKKCKSRSALRQPCWLRGQTAIYYTQKWIEIPTLGLT